MLQAHSLLWHYLWVAPNVLLFVLAFLIWKNGLRKAFPAFFAFALFSSLGQFALYTADVAPTVSAENFWRVDWGTLLIEGPLKFVLIGAVFAQIFGQYPSVAQLGRLLISAVGITLVLSSALAAAYAPQGSHFGIISGAHLLDQTIYLIESGLLVFIFLFAAYFRLKPTRLIFGIALGLAISACVHLATWAVIANGGWANSTRARLDFLNMATYHVCVLIWFYYLLMPAKISPKAAAPLPESNLSDWNRELERLVQHRLSQP
jgi:hypothetical protein